MKVTAREIAIVLLEVDAEIMRLGDRLSEIFGDAEIPVDPKSKLENLVMDLAGIPPDTGDGWTSGYSRDGWSSDFFDRQKENQSPEEIWDWLVSQQAKDEADGDE